MTGSGTNRLTFGKVWLASGYLYKNLKYSLRDTQHKHHKRDRNLLKFCIRVYSFKDSTWPREHQLVELCRYLGKKQISVAGLDFDRVFAAADLGASSCSEDDYKSASGEPASELDEFVALWSAWKLTKN